VPSTRPLADALQCRASTMHGLRRLTSIEAFALALVEASSRVGGAAAAHGTERLAVPGGLDEDAASAAE
jgi:hypothetical protein